MNDFIKASIQERQHIKDSNLLERLNSSFLKKGYIYVSHFITDAMGNDPYEMSINYHNPDKGSLVVYIEVKVRYEKYDEYIMQKDKFERIKDRAKWVGKHIILYVNYCPDGTYIWQVDNIEKFKLEKRKCKKYTSVSNPEYVNKMVYLLPVSEAKYFDYVHSSNNPDTYFVNYVGTEISKDTEI